MGSHSSGPEKKSGKRGVLHDEAEEVLKRMCTHEEEFGLSSKSCWGYHAKMGLVGKSDRG